MEQRFPLLTDGLLVTYEGAWAAGNNYAAGALVQNTGTYMCIAGHLSAAATEPGVGADWQTVWVAFVVVTGTYSSTYFKAEDTAPYYRLIDGSDNDVLVRLNAGVLEFYDNGNSTLRASIDMATGEIAAASATLSGEIAAASATLSGALTVGTAKTDHQIIIPIAPGAAIVSTWTASVASNVLIVTRTAAVSTGQYRVPILLPARTGAGKGAKLKSVIVCYTVGSADTTNDQLLVQIVKQTTPTDGNSPVGSVLAGDADADYDTAHDTKAERLTAGTHTLTVTIPAGERAYLADGEQLYLEVLVTDAATANLTFAMKSAVATYDASEY